MTCVHMAVIVGQRYFARAVALRRILALALVTSLAETASMQYGPAAAQGIESRWVTLTTQDAPPPSNDLERPNLKLRYRRTADGSIIGAYVHGYRLPPSMELPEIDSAYLKRLIDMAPDVEELRLQGVVALAGMLEPLQGATKLRTLYLNHCQSLSLKDLTSIPHSVEQLRIDGRLDVNGATRMDHLSRLKILHLCSLDLTDESYRMLLTLPAIEELGCTNCAGFSDQTVKLLDGNVNLRRLHLVDVAITDDAMNSLARHRQLEYLWLPGTITVRGLRQLVRCDSLQTLGLQGPNIDNDTVAVLRALPGLTHLHLLVTAIDDAGLAKLGRMPHLRVLEIFGCESVTGSGLAAFAAVSRVQDLSLGATPIGDEAFQSLQGMASLETVNVSITNVSSKAIDAFRLARPSVKVFGTDDLRKAAEDFHLRKPWPSWPERE